MADKIREIADELTRAAWMHRSHDYSPEFERILRAELEPLLRAARDCQAIAYHMTENNLRLMDGVVGNKVDSINQQLQVLISGATEGQGKAFRPYWRIAKRGNNWLRFACGDICVR